MEKGGQYVPIVNHYIHWLTMDGIGQISLTMVNVGSMLHALIMSYYFFPPRKSGPWTRLTYWLAFCYICREFIKNPKRLFTVYEMMHTFMRWVMCYGKWENDVTLDISNFGIWKTHLKRFCFCSNPVNVIWFENEYKMYFQPLLHWWKIHCQSSTLLITKSIRYLCCFFFLVWFVYPVPWY